MFCKSSTNGQSLFGQQKTYPSNQSIRKEPLRQLHQILELVESSKSSNFRLFVVESAVLRNQPHGGSTQDITEIFLTLEKKELWEEIELHRHGPKHTGAGQYDMNTAVPS